MATPEPAAACVLVPGMTLCAACRSRDAELLEDPGERGERPLCFECAEDALERLNALGENRAAFDLLVQARTEARYRPLPVKLLDWETADRSKLEELHRQWVAYQATVTELERCWAIVSDGGRCVRAAAEGLAVCETHAAMGCRLPGLGWRGGAPQGQTLVHSPVGAA